MKNVYIDFDRFDLLPHMNKKLELGALIRSRLWLVVRDRLIALLTDVLWTSFKVSGIEWSTGYILVDFFFKKSSAFM